MSEAFVVKRVRRRRLKGKVTNEITPTPTPEPTPIPVPEPTPIITPPDPTPVPNETNNDNVMYVDRDSVLPEYLMNPPATPDGVVLEGNHTKELVCSYRVAKEVLGSSFRPKESNLAVGKIRV